MKTCLILIISLFAFIELKAQDDTEQKTEQSADDLAKQLANPNATLGVLFTQFDYSRYSGDVPDAGQNGIVFNFQPSLPIPLGPGVNLFVRPLIPVYLSQPVAGPDGLLHRVWMSLAGELSSVQRRGCAGQERARGAALDRGRDRPNSGLGGRMLAVAGKSFKRLAKCAVSSRRPIIASHVPPQFPLHFEPGPFFRREQRFFRSYGCAPRRDWGRRRTAD